MRQKSGRGDAILVLKVWSIGVSGGRRWRLSSTNWGSTRPNPTLPMSPLPKTTALSWSPTPASSPNRIPRIFTTSSRRLCVEMFTAPWAEGSFPGRRSCCWEWRSWPSFPYEWLLGWVCCFSTTRFAESVRYFTIPIGRRMSRRTTRTWRDGGGPWLCGLEDFCPEPCCSC